MASEKIREIKSGSVMVQTFDYTEIASDPITWLIQQAKPDMLLLAHADDGVIWGRVITDHNNTLKFNFASHQVDLHNQTLIMARLFDADQEIFLWRVDEGEWRARRIQDGAGEARDYFDEAQILWGDSEEKPQAEKEPNNFVHLTEGAQGLRHAPPKELLSGAIKKHRAQLTVRHYLQEENDWLQVAFSRLVKPDTKEMLP